MMLLMLLAAVSAAGAVEPTVINLQIEPQQEVCFHEDVPAGYELEATALVYRGGKLDIKLRIEGPGNSIRYEQLLHSNIDDATGATLSAIVKKGTKMVVERAETYTVCLDNRMARWTAKVATLELTVRNTVGSDEFSAPGELAADATDSMKAAHALAELRSAAARLHHKMVTVESAQYMHYHRETQHRDTIESTNSRVMWWSVAEAAVVLGFTAAQVLVVRTWFGGAAGGGRRVGSLSRSESQV